MAFGDLMLNTRFHRLTTNGRTASMDMSPYFNNPKVRNYVNIYGVMLRNTTANEVTLYNPTVIVNGKSIIYETSVSIKPNEVKLVGRDNVTGSFNEVSINNSTLNFSLSGLIPAGVVFDSTQTFFDSTNIYDIPNAGISINIVVHGNNIAPSNVSFIGEANIYEDIEARGSLPADADLFAVLSRDNSRSEKPIRRLQGYTDKIVFKAGYFETTSSSRSIQAYMTVNNSTHYGSSGTVVASGNLVAIKPSILNLSINTNIIESPIVVSWFSDKQLKFELELFQNDISIYKKSEDTPRNNFTIPANTIKQEGPTAIKVRVMKSGNISWSDWASTTRDMEYNKPTIDNLSVIGDNWERPITVNWRSTYQDKYEYELYYNNINIKTGSGSKETTFIIPENTFSGTLPSSVRVRTIRVVNGINIYSNWAERNISLKDIAATISNLLVNGEFWEKPISLSWQSVEQQQFKIEVFKDNVIAKTYNGNTERAYTIPADTLGAGQYTFKVSVAYANRFVNSQSRTLDLKDVKASVSEFSLSGSNIDLPLTMTWVSENQEKWEIKVLLGQTEKLSYSGLLENSKDLPVGTINITGLYTFMIRVAFRDRWSEWKSFDRVLTETLPAIGILEPDGRVLDGDSPIRVYWTSVNQSRWSLSVNGNDFSGTNEKEQILQAGLLSTGRASVRLTVYLDIAGKEKKETKTVEFIVRGRPPAPTITSGSSFNSNRPTFTWDTRDQNSFILNITDLNDDIVYDTGWINGLIVSHKIETYLSDGNYTVSIKVKNIYAEESEWSRKQFNISTTKGNEIVLTAIKSDNSSTLEWSSSGYDMYYVFRNGEMIYKTDGYIYYDYTSHGDNNYFIRGVNSLDVFNDSNSELLFTSFQFPILSLGGSDVVQLVYKNGLSDIDINYNPMSNKVFYSGRKSPVTVNGEHEDYSYSLDYSEIDKESYFKVLDMISTKNPLLYRSDRYKLWLTFDGVGLIDNYNDMVYSLDGYKIDYSEVVEYD